MVTNPASLLDLKTLGFNGENDMKKQVDQATEAALEADLNSEPSIARGNRKVKKTKLKKSAPTKYYLVLFLLLAACAQPKNSEPVSGVAKRPNKTVSISRAVCDEIADKKITTDYLVLSSDQTIMVMLDKVYIFDFDSGKPVPVQDEVLDIDGFCILTVEDGILTNIQTTPEPTPSPDQGGHCNWWGC